MLKLHWVLGGHYEDLFAKSNNTHTHTRITLSHIILHGLFKAFTSIHYEYVKHLVFIP